MTLVTMFPEATHSAYGDNRQEMHGMELTEGPMGKESCHDKHT